MRYEIIKPSYATSNFKKLHFDTPSLFMQKYLIKKYVLIVSSSSKRKQRSITVSRKANHLPNQ